VKVLCPAAEALQTSMICNVSYRPNVTAIMSAIPLFLS